MLRHLSGTARGLRILLVCRGRERCQTGWIDAQRWEVILARALKRPIAITEKNRSVLQRKFRNESLLALFKPHGVTMPWQSIDDDSWTGKSKDSSHSYLLNLGGNMNGKMTRDYLAAELSLVETDELATFIRLLLPQIGAVPSDLENGLNVGVEVCTLSVVPSSCPWR